MGKFLSFLGGLVALLIGMLLVGLGASYLMIYLLNMADNTTTVIYGMVFGVVFWIVVCVIWAIKKKNLFDAICDLGYWSGLLIGTLIAGIIVGLIIGYVFDIEDEMTCSIYGIVVVIAIGVVTYIKEKMDDRKRKNSTSYSSSRSYSSSSGYSSYGYKPSQSHDSGYDDVIAAASAQEMSRATAYYGEDWKGYDPEAIQPWEKDDYDPEAPQPWDTNWLDAE